MTTYSDAEKNLMLAAFTLGQAQRDLEEAQCRFQEALHRLELAEAAASPTAKEVRGILAKRGR